MKMLVLMQVNTMVVLTLRWLVSENNENRGVLQIKGASGDENADPYAGTRNGGLNPQLSGLSQGITKTEV